MQTLLDLLLKYGYAILFANICAEQLGLPIPAPPMLLAMGVLAGLGKVSFATCVGLGVLGSLIGDCVWYELGRTRGHAILTLLCKVSLEPDSCVNQTKQRWNRFGGFTLVFAKFVPGLSTVSTPLAGLTRMPFARFLILDAIGAAVWVSAYLGIGYIFRNQVERGAEVVQQFGTSMMIGVCLVLAAYLGWKYYKRQRFLKELRVAKISPGELLGLINAGEAVTIVDLRNAIERDADGVVLPTAIPISFADIEADESVVPRNKEIILYCSCPNDASSARAALLLMRRGVSRVRPLAGGIETWRQLGYPLEPMEATKGRR